MFIANYSDFLFVKYEIEFFGKQLYYHKINI